MKQSKSTLGRLGEKVFALMQLKSQEIITLGELQPVLQITRKQEKELLSRLARKGYIVRLVRGTYLIPSKLPPGGRWMPDEYTIIYELMKLWAADYQICGPLAFQKYGLRKQVPNVITIYNTKKSGLRRVGKLNLQLIKVSSKRIGATEKIKLRDNKQVYISSRARSIVDAVYDWSRFNTLPEALEWIRQLQNDSKFIDELIKITCQYSNVNTMRRIGFVLDSLNIEESNTKRILKLLQQTQGWIPLDPSKPTQGKTNKKWGLINNGNFEQSSDSVSRVVK